MASPEQLITRIDEHLDPKLCIQAARRLSFSCLWGTHFSGEGTLIDGAWEFDTDEIIGLPDTASVRGLLGTLTEILEPETPYLTLRVIKNYPFFRGIFHSDRREGRRLIAPLKGNGRLQLAGPKRGAQYVDGQLPVLGEIEMPAGSIAMVNNVPDESEREMHRYINGGITRIALLVSDELPQVGYYGREFGGYRN